MVSVSLCCPLFGCAALRKEKKKPRKKKRVSFKRAKEIVQPSTTSKMRNEGKGGTGRKDTGRKDTDL